MRIITLKGVFNGLYEWGEGWDSYVQHRWKDYWRNEMKSIFWSYFEDNKHSFGSTDYLVGTGGSIFLHPMNFTLLYNKIGKCFHIDKDGNEIEEFTEIDDLREICENCAKRCGGSFVIKDFKITEI